MNVETISYKIQAGNHQAVVELRIQKLSHYEKLLRSVKRVALMLLVIGVSVVIPILHFILLPIALIITIIIAVTSFRVSSLLVGDTICCPACSNKVTVHPRPSRAKMSDVCESCNRALEFQQS